MDERTAFSKLASHLINRGLVLIEDTYTASHSSESRYARYRFHLVASGQGFLPPFPAAFEDVATTPRSDCAIDFVRQAFKKALLPDAQIKSTMDGPVFDWLSKGISIWNRRLCLGVEEILDLDYLFNRIAKQWVECHVTIAKANAKTSASDESFAWAMHILWCAYENKGLTVPHLLAALAKLGLSPTAGAISSFLEEGRQCGFVRVGADKDQPRYVGLRKSAIMANIGTDKLVATATGEGVAVDLDKCGVTSLLSLAQISQASIRDGSLILTPDLVRIGKAYKEQPVWQEVRGLSPVFESAFKTVEDRRGKLLVHENLAVLRVDDIGLRAVIQHKFAGKVLLIDQAYIALPAALTTEVEAIVRKQGYSVRRFTA
jgi:hypothetical protein